MIETFDELINRTEPLDAELYPYLQLEGDFPMLKHPLVFGVPYTEGLNAYYNEQLK